MLRGLAIGYTGDLTDGWDEGSDGFDHELISDIFREELMRLHASSAEWLDEIGLSTRRRKLWGAGSSLDFFIYGQDYDRGMAALLKDFGESRRRGLDEADSSSRGPAGRTRVSAILQRCLATSRRVLDQSRALRSAKRHEYFRVSVPSPLWVAKEILTDPNFPASQAYATAALRAYLFERLERKHGVNRIDLSYDAISTAYETILNRHAVSRDLFLGTASSQATLISHFLASQGLMHLQIRYNPARPDFSDRFQLIFGDILDEESYIFALTRKGISVRFDAGLVDLPKASDLVTELTGLPLPIEGASVLFHGGLRLADGGDLVAAFTGTFGAGKTSVCLGIAAALAPLGCKTLFLSCEEKKEDIDARLREAIPSNLTKSTPLLRGVRLLDHNASEPFPWFLAASLNVVPGEAEADAEDHIADSLLEILESIFVQDGSLPSEQELNGTSDPTKGARLVVIDGIHQLFRGASGAQGKLERALSKIVHFCRNHRAIFFFTVGEGEREDRRLEYVCDLVIALDRVGFDSSEKQPSRVLKLLKARRQAVRPGAHLFHLTAPRGFRVKPSLAAIADEGKSRGWINPDPDQVLYISPEPAGSSASNRDYVRQAIQKRVVGFSRYSQILIKGRGSSGKSALAMSLIHRRPLPSIDGRKTERNKYIRDLGFEVTDSSFESRLLIISFLYPEQHYSQFLGRLQRPNEHIQSESLQPLPPGQLVLMSEGELFTTEEPPALPARRVIADLLKQDVLSLYPGHLMPEDFLAKIRRRLDSAELQGLPYTGVLIDGIHNVQLQFPELERELDIWPQLYTMLRRRGLTSVITHTEFQVNDSFDSTDLHSLSGFEERAAFVRSVPMLSTLVSAGDYVIDVAPVGPLVLRELDNTIIELRFSATVKGSLDDASRGAQLLWDRARCRWYVPTQRIREYR